MRTLILSAIAWLHVTATAQSNTASNIIEGGKTLVELVRVFKTPKYIMAVQPPVVEKKDSCALKFTTDMCIKNSGTTPMLISLYKRNGNVYEPGVLSLKISPKNQECLYELKAGVYKIKYEIEEGAIKKLIKEGEIKLNACENMFKEIKNDPL
ncbi:MAG: hypothetical protein ABIN74_11575 [Ferruginibacter sp.]